MIHSLGLFLEGIYGPFRLLTSHFFLSGLSLLFCFTLTFVLLPKLMNRLSRDRGRAHAVDASASQGKPTGTGIVFISIFVLVELLFLPLSAQVIGILAFTFLAMLSGWLDDKAVVSWGEYKKGLIDLFLGLGGAILLCQMQDTTVWLPFTTQVLTIPPLVFIPLATVLLWATINSTNCSDGVDGLSGSLVAIGLTTLGALLYFILGHADVSRYLLLPHLPDGATWGIMAFSMVGCLMGYLWYNANPSILLMGDAGSRALGFLIGVLVIKTGNPFLILVVASVLLINGGTGLIKVALLRFFKISLLKNIRFPLHDHMRHNKKWSNTQVLVRFSLVQVMVTLVLLMLLIKIR